MESKARCLFLWLSSICRVTATLLQLEVMVQVLYKKVQMANPDLRSDHDIATTPQNSGF